MPEKNNQKKTHDEADRPIPWLFYSGVAFCQSAYVLGRIQIGVPDIIQPIMASIQVTHTLIGILLSAWVVGCVVFGVSMLTIKNPDNELTTSATGKKRRSNVNVVTAMSRLRLKFPGKELITLTIGRKRRLNINVVVGMLLVIAAWEAVFGVFYGIQWLIDTLF